MSSIPKNDALVVLTPLLSKFEELLLKKLVPIAAILAVSLAACSSANGPSQIAGAVPTAASKTIGKGHRHPHTIWLLRSAVLYKDGVKVYGKMATENALDSSTPADQPTSNAGTLGGLPNTATTMYYDSNGNVFVGLVNGNVKVYAKSSVDHVADNPNTAVTPSGTLQCANTNGEADTAITMAPNGYLYFGSSRSDGNNAEVCVFTKAEVASAVGGQTVAANGTFELGLPAGMGGGHSFKLTGLAADPSGNIYAAGTDTASGNATIYNYNSTKVAQVEAGLFGVFASGTLAIGSSTASCGGATFVRPLVFDASGDLIAVNPSGVAYGYAYSQLPTTSVGLTTTRTLSTSYQYGAVVYDINGNLYVGLQSLASGNNIGAVTLSTLTSWWGGGTAAVSTGYDGGGHCVTAASMDSLNNGGMFIIQNGLAEAMINNNIARLVNTYPYGTGYSNLAVPAGDAALDVLPMLGT